MPRIPYVVAAALVALLLTPAAAQAQRWSGTDVAGDVVADRYHYDPAPCGHWTWQPDPDNAGEDLVSMAVRHTRRFLFVTLAHRDLTERQRNDAQILLLHGDAGWVLEVGRHGVDVGSGYLMTWQEPTRHTNPEGCPRLSNVHEFLGQVRVTVDDDADTIRTRVRRARIDDVAWVQVAAQAERATYDVDGISGWWDTFGERDPENPSAAPLTPPVHAAGTVARDVVLRAHRAVLLPRH